VVVVVSSASRNLRRALRPLAWVILEEVALDAVVEEGRLVARTSARQVAERVGVNPGTAAEALRVLSRRGLVSLEREKGPAGRFGLSVYRLAPVAGLCVVRPCAAGPLMASPSLVEPNGLAAMVVSPSVAASRLESSRLEGSTPAPADHPSLGAAGGRVSMVCDPDRSTATPREGWPPSPGRSSPDPLQSPRQETFDLGSASP
jgi:DNA-binding transcriptional ArsR family regulator